MSLKSQAELTSIMQRREELHPDLAAFITEGCMGNMLHHPLLVSIVYAPAMNALLNQQYLAKLEQTAKALEEHDADRYVWLHERGYRVQALQYWLRTNPSAIKEASFWGLLGSVWVDSENIYQCREWWDALLRSADKDVTYHMMREADAERFRKLSFPLPLYRGSGSHNKRGLSWTLSRSKAVWFANRWANRGGTTENLYHMKLTDSSQAVAFLGGRGEDEIIIHPDAAEFSPISKVDLGGSCDG